QERCCCLVLAELHEKHTETEIVISVSELEHGLHRAVMPEQTQRRRDYLETTYAAIPIQPFTKEMGQLGLLALSLTGQRRRVVQFAGRKRRENRRRFEIQRQADDWNSGDNLDRT